MPVGDLVVAWLVVIVMYRYAQRKLVDWRWVPLTGQYDGSVVLKLARGYITPRITVVALSLIVIDCHSRLVR